MGGKKKSNSIRTKDIIRRGKSKVISERMKTKSISRQDQTIETKEDIPKHRKKILPTSRRRMCKNVPATGCEGSKIILDQNMGPERPLQPNGLAI